MPALRVLILPINKEGHVWHAESLDPDREYIVKYHWKDGWSYKSERVKGKQLSVLPKFVMPPYEETQLFKRKKEPQLKLF